MTKAPIIGFAERASDLLELIHTDGSRTMSTTARGRFQYFITFTDDFSRYAYVYLMKHKSETFKVQRISECKYRINMVRKLRICDLNVEANI